MAAATFNKAVKREGGNSRCRQIARDTVAIIQVARAPKPFLVKFCMEHGVLEEGLVP